MYTSEFKNSDDASEIAVEYSIHLLKDNVTPLPDGMYLTSIAVLCNYALKVLNRTYIIPNEIPKVLLHSSLPYFPENINPVFVADAIKVVLTHYGYRSIAHDVKEYLDKMRIDEKDVSSKLIVTLEKDWEITKIKILNSMTNKQSLFKSFTYDTLTYDLIMQKLEESGKYYKPMPIGAFSFCAYNILVLVGSKLAIALNRIDCHIPFDLR